LKYILEYENPFKGKIIRDFVNKKRFVEEKLLVYLMVVLFVVNLVILQIGIFSSVGEEELISDGIENKKHAIAMGDVEIDDLIEDANEEIEIESLESRDRNRRIDRDEDDSEDVNDGQTENSNANENEGEDESDYSEVDDFEDNPDDDLYVPPNEDPDAPEAESVDGKNLEFSFDFGVVK
jgi:hypothetical protein